MLVKNKIGLVTGVANEYSLAWAIARRLAAEGAKLAFTYQGERLQKKVESLVATLPKACPTLPCDVGRDEQIERVFDALEREFGQLDFLVHSIAYAKREDLSGPITNVSRMGFITAQDISAFSLVHFARHAAPLMAKGGGGAIATLTYLGSEKVIPNYNVMGLCKASLEAAVRYLAADLGPHNIRVNAVSAGPVKTAAARAIKGFPRMLDQVARRAPLQRNVTPDEIANATLFLLSDLSSGITGQVVYVDAGYEIMGM